jgi:hypothetical protein
MRYELFETHFVFTRNILGLPVIDLSAIWKFDLTKGASFGPKNGACIMDAVSWFEYGHLGDRPPCVCPVIGQLCIVINDMLSDDERQKLKPYIFKVIGTVDSSAVKERSLTVIDYVFCFLLNTYSYSQSWRTEIAKCEHVVFREIKQHNFGQASKYALALLFDLSFRTAAPSYSSIYVLPPSSVVFLFSLLNAVLAIGKQAEPYDGEKAVKAVEYFAAARGEKV